MQLFLKKLFLTFVAVTLLANTFTFISFYSQLHATKVIDNTTGKIVFEEEANSLSDLADCLISDNNNFTKDNNRSITSSTFPQSRIEIKASNLYLVLQSRYFPPSTKKCILTMEFEDGYNHNLIIRARGRGS